MRLSTLLTNIVTVPADVDREINQLGLDSRQVKPNDVFIAIKGFNFDGHNFIQDAISNGASAVLIDSSHSTSIEIKDKAVLIPVAQLRSKLSAIAACFYQFPAKDMQLFGVTGTNGKTSCTHYLAQSLQTMKIHCGIIGTLGYGFYHQLKHVELTTPDAISLQAILRELVNQGAQAIAMEVSSHSIDQDRINDIIFDIGIFTNLTRDHLDYHGTMEAYAATKRKFLAGPNTKTLILNGDDHYGKMWIHELGKEKTVFSYSVHEGKQRYKKHISARNTRISFSGIDTIVSSPWGEAELHLPLVGLFNLSNAFAVLGALCACGHSFEKVLSLIGQLQSVPGRMERLQYPHRPLVIVDYSHSPDSLEKALQAIREHTKGKLICVFGCGGDRDKGKRPQMAAIAEMWADKIIVTSDNPRHEDPNEIINQIMQGFRNSKQVMVEVDRAKAIEMSIQNANQEDCILIAGKGAESYQIIGDKKIPFNDVLKARQFLQPSGGSNSDTP